MEISQNSDNFWRSDKHRYYGIADEMVRLKLNPFQGYLMEKFNEKIGKEIYNKVYDVCFEIIKEVKK